MNVCSLSVRFVSLSLVVAGIQALEAQRPGGAGTRNPLIQALDRNGDGEISEAEIATASESLRRLDQNRDGRVESGELGGGRQTPGRGGGAGRGRGGPGGGSELVLVPKFDANGDGALLGEERQRARAEVKKQREGARRRFGGEAPEPQPGKAISIDDVEDFPETAFYDPETIRTLFLEFPQEDWEAELAEFYRTDVLVPATLTLDGGEYSDVGVSFRGNSSFFTVREGQKRSINLVMDFLDSDQNLLGYRTINLLNAHTDPSFLREVTFNYVARNYIPAPLANFVRVVINGEDWGIYVNSQQINKEFTEAWFGSRGGVRWKIRAGGGPRALNYNGDDPEEYRSLYEAKSNESERAWQDLVRVCRDLNTIPVEELDLRLDRILDVDRALWFLAMDNVLIDSDGYYTRGSDYMVYQEPKFERFHLLPYDSNETFRYPGGGGPGGGTAIRVEGVQLSPFAGEENESRPLLNRLMANPRIRARYIAHVRTIVEEWFETGRLEQQFDVFHALISDYVKQDTRKLYTSEAFVSNLIEDAGSGRRPTPGLKSFAEARRDYFRNFPELQREPARIAAVQREKYEEAPVGGQPVGISAQLENGAEADQVLLYYASDRRARFRSVVMNPTGVQGQFRGEVPGMGAGSRVYYYVESRKGNEPIVSYFWPRNPVLGAASYSVATEQSSNSAIVINEVMPVNVSAARDPQGDFDDWIEIHNPTDQPIELSGMHLTDSFDDLRQWTFPSGSVIPANGYLIVWADGDVGKSRGFHADFKLSANGETILLVDTDERGNAIVDQLTYTQVGKDESFGRLPDGNIDIMPPTPGRQNR